ncbi:hypothetical protein CDAR_13041 [Caerostris darwini]|uniref:Uncharacterized protein n=1 Tax=Caerostris darwini TaxID=1538125 RepID=A0AAV4Q437_9ARAC|nr:hypothetical protein CDAR_13041 [Caerostris darwini]
MLNDNTTISMRKRPSERSFVTVENKKKGGSFRRKDNQLLIQNTAYSFPTAKAVTPTKPWPIRCKGVFHNRIGVT